MRKFNQLFEKSAADYKVVKDDDAEVKGLKPRSKGEEDFVALHKINKKKYPVNTDNQHVGSTKSNDHVGFEKSGEPILKTYAQFAKMGGFGGNSYKGVGKSAGEKTAVMQGSSKIKEEVELGETFKAGELKLNSGETVKIDGATAELLNNTFKQLSGPNKSRMESEAMKNKNRFDSIVKFAKSVM